jgi:hypothetical protein
VKTKEPEPLQHPEITFVPNPYATTLGPVFRAQVAREILLVMLRTKDNPKSWTLAPGAAVDLADMLIKELRVKEEGE